MQLPPGQGDPARAGSEPCSGGGNESGAAWARKRVGRGESGHKIYEHTACLTTINLPPCEKVEIFRSDAKTELSEPQCPRGEAHEAWLQLQSIQGRSYGTAYETGGAIP